MTCWFITGTDTEIGKTIASSALLQAATALNLCAIGYKPVASGCQITSNGIQSNDVLILQKYSTLKLNYEQINPFAFIGSTSPHIVSKEENKVILFEKMSSGLTLLKQQAEFIVIEGVGGWLTLLSDTQTYADWVFIEQLPVILVVGIKLGCLNHAMLTIESIRAKGLNISGWIANVIEPPGKYHKAYLNTLLQQMDTLFLGEIPYLTYEEQKCCGKYLILEKLLSL